MFHVKHRRPKIVVVGGGHAGVEAAAAAARVGGEVSLVTLKADAIGTMSCNPAIGGLGKGHLVREIDALGGLMGVAADSAGIHFRLLNRRKGPAVQGPRAQMDRVRYREAIQHAVYRQERLTVVEDQVIDLIMEGDRLVGVELERSGKMDADAVVITTGTFLNGVIHIGETHQSAGRMGEGASRPLADRFYAMGLPIGRLKTGTPPRLDGNTIDWQRLEAQPGDDDPVMLSFLSHAPKLRQIHCAITHTNTETHDIVRANLDRSAMYSGNISGIGPRYCPSIEDKIARFADKDSHQIFLEPEGLGTSTVYPNGISTSLPGDVQERYVRSIVGLENAEIVQLGYAVEYDFVNPMSLGHGLCLKDVPNLYLAGQINGTTGYEEAGAQGLIAGINAVLSVRRDDPFILSRADAYTGVMIDDLVTKGVSEPYRMFTSRAEFRLQLRADNADQRLTPRGIDLGLVSEGRQQCFVTKAEKLETARAALSGCVVKPKEAVSAGIPISSDGMSRSALDLLSISGVSMDDIRPLLPSEVVVDLETGAQLEREAVYAHYYARQERQRSQLQKDEAMVIPEALDFDHINGLSSELKSKLKATKPKSIAHAAKIEGMTPAGLNAILFAIRSRKIAGAA